MGVQDLFLALTQFGLGRLHLAEGRTEEAQVALRHAADIAEAMIVHAKLDTTPEDLEALAEKEGLLRLY